MEMRACQDVDTSQDLTSPLLPLAAALRPRFLATHCSACFRPVLCPNPPAPLSCCGGAVRYCSTACMTFDFGRHSDSGECRLLRLMPSADDTELRLALRLLLFFQRAGLLPSRSSLRRIGGLLGADGEEEEKQKESEGNDMVNIVSEWASILSRSRGMVSEAESTTAEEYDGRGDVERATLWIVLKNAVEVQVGEGLDLGLAVYGPDFSWFNHSCSPNACYRFELYANPWLESAAAARDGRGFLVSPRGDGPETEDIMEAWSSAEQQMNLELCHYGPRITVRSIKRIRKFDEVCVTYVDLLQPKAKRQADLLSKYRFLCMCSRCCQPREAYVDRTLSKSYTEFAQEEVDMCDDTESESLDELAQELDELIEEHLTSENPEICCQNIEKMLAENVFVPLGKCKLHPLHHISLDAYVTLASIYKIRLNSLLATESADIMQPEAFKMGTASAAYTVLLAVAVHHFFSIDQSVIGSAAVFWVSAGDSLTRLVKMLMRNSSGYLVNRSEVALLFSQPLFAQTREEMLDRQAQLEATSSNCITCIKKLLVDVWPNLVADLPCVKSIQSPINFISSDRTKLYPGFATLTENSFSQDKCLGCKAEENLLHGAEGELDIFCQLAIHCLVYGGYLAATCYSSDCFLVSQVTEILCGTVAPFF